MWHSHTSLRCCYLGAVAPRFLAAFHWACVVAVPALVLPGPARLDKSLLTGWKLPWALFPHLFSYHPPTSHGMSRLEVRVCLHILKCCLDYFPEILDYISSESLVPS